MAREGGALDRTGSEDRVRREPLGRAGRCLLAAWLALSLLGALNDTFARRVIGQRLELRLPHLESGHTMFVHIPRTTRVHEYIDDDGERRPVAELMQTQGLLYARARIETNLVLAPTLLEQICRRHYADVEQATTFVIDEYKLNYHPERPYLTTELTCDERGLSRRRAAR